MSILVNTHNDLEEKVLIAFLDSLRYDYKSAAVEEQEGLETFLNQYNQEIDKAEAEINAGDYSDQDHVEKLFADRRKSL